LARVTMVQGGPPHAATVLIANVFKMLDIFYKISLIRFSGSAKNRKNMLKHVSSHHVLGHPVQGCCTCATCTLLNGCCSHLRHLLWFHG